MPANTDRTQDREINDAESAGFDAHVSNLVSIINDLDNQLTEAKEEIEKLQQQIADREMEE